MKALLAIDVGNTRTACALIRGGKITSEWSDSTMVLSSPVHAVRLIRQGVDAASDIEGVCVASVVPDRNPILSSTCENALRIKPSIIKPSDIDLPVKGYDLEQIGIDRLINALAGYEIAEGACIVIDAGSCITFDAVSKRGHYLGGAIVPGISLSMMAMHKMTARIPLVEYKKACRAIGKDTSSSVRSGIHFGFEGLVERVALEIAREMKCEPTIIATGGDADFIKKSLSGAVVKCPKLIFEGIRLIWENKFKGES